MKFPATIGACIDALYKLKQDRAALEKKAGDIADKETALENHILATFSKADLDGARGKLATAGVKRDTVPTVKDWDKLYAYIVKNKAFELLQRRPSTTAFRERWEAKQVVPGVEQFHTTKLSLKKR